MADQLVAGVAEHHRGCRVDRADQSTLVDGQYGIRGRLDQGAEALFGLLQVLQMVLTPLPGSQQRQRKPPAQHQGRPGQRQHQTRIPQHFGIQRRAWNAVNRIEGQIGDLSEALKPMFAVNPTGGHEYAAEGANFHDLIKLGRFILAAHGFGGRELGVSGDQPQVLGTDRCDALGRQSKTLQSLSESRGVNVGVDHPGKGAIGPVESTCEHHHMAMGDPGKEWPVHDQSVAGIVSSLLEKRAIRQIGDRLGGVNSRPEHHTAPGVGGAQRQDHILAGSVDQAQVEAEGFAGSD